MKERMSVCEAHQKGLIKEGVVVRTNGSMDWTTGVTITGITGVVDKEIFYVFQDEIAGGLPGGLTRPRSLGLRFSWAIELSNDEAWIEFPKIQIKRRSAQ